MVNGNENQYDDEIAGARSGWSAPHPLSFAALAADQALFGQGVRLCGWSVRETAGATATGRFWSSGTIGQGEIVGGVSLAANAAETQWLGDSGVLCEGGLSYDVLSGAVDLVVYVRHWMGF